MPPRKTPSKKRGAGDGPYTPWTASAPDVCAKLDVDPQTGLSETKVDTLRSSFGFNELDKEEGTPLWKLVLQQFDDLLVKILLGAATLSFVRPCAQTKNAGLP